MDRGEHQHKDRQQFQQVVRAGPRRAGAARCTRRRRPRTGAASRVVQIHHLVRRHVLRGVHQHFFA
eukprot:3972673-Prymnesium_polylepis.1